MLALVWLVVGVAMVAVPVWLGWTRWQAVLTGHPVSLAVTIVTGLLGFVAVAWAVATLLLRDRWETAARPRTERQRVQRSSRRVALAVPTLVLCVLTVVLLAWSRPVEATAPALAAARSGAGVRVSDRLTWYEMTPVARDRDGDVVRPTTGLVFVPGARVDPRAYAAVLRPLAQAGYLVAVLKEPFGVALLDGRNPRKVMEAHPEVARWVVGGHSLGGVSAAAFADGHPRVGSAAVAGLVLWASYPAGRLERTDLQVVSVSGEQDGLTTPEDVEHAREQLPAGTRYVVVPGAVHSTFGDYGEQDGDGTPTGDRAEAQAAITGATRELLAAVTPRPPRRK